MFYINCLLGVLAGTLIPLQAGINSKLREHLSSRTTALIASIIGGQLICSLILDQFGLIGFAQHPINLGRIVGVVLLVAGVALIQKY
ncbi:MAG: DMT family transporter [Candidatus Obscuribacterales bacterium]|nr:DMT family transporter [Candidatus Obscuribacterales bacterium]